MDSDFHQQQYQHHFQEFPRQFHQPKPQTNSLTRFCSAPSSYFSSFLDVAAETINTTGGAIGGGGGGERRDFMNARPLSPETENIFNNFMSSIGVETNDPQKLSNIPETTAALPNFTMRVKQETDFQPQQPPAQQKLQQANYSSQSQMVFHSQSKPPLSNQHKSAVSSAKPNSLTASTMGIAVVPQMKTGLGGGNSNKNSGLTRYSSSPAGFFDSLNIDTITGYGIMGSAGTRNYNTSNVQMNYSSSEQISTSDLMNQNSDVAGKIARMNNLDDERFNSQNDRNFGYTMTSWDDSVMSEKFSGADDSKTFTELTSSENQSEERSSRPPRLSHHLSLPKTLTDISAMENFLLFQDTVPCRVRAKRGCATHPRSIAERVRRTKISERMRKLQDLVPNMDKQTNTADMLDLAVDYIKDLQKQVETLTYDRAQCTCSK